MSATSPVSIHPYFKIHPGQFEAAQALIPAFIAKTSTEAKVLHYGFSHGDGVVFCREAYTDADGLLAHLQNVEELLGQMLTHSELLRLEVHAPAEAVAQLRAPLAHLPVTWYEIVDELRK